MSQNLARKTVYLSNAEAQTLAETGTVTLASGEVITYDAGDTYFGPEENATTTSDGLMSKEDKTKLDGITSNNLVTAQEKTNIASNTTARHTHSNMTALNNLTQAVITNSHTHSNKTTLDSISSDNITYWTNKQNKTIFLSYADTLASVKTAIESSAETEVVDEYGTNIINEVMNGDYDSETFANSSFNSHDQSFTNYNAYIITRETINNHSITTGYFYYKFKRLSHYQSGDIINVIETTVPDRIIQDDSTAVKTKSFGTQLYQHTFTMHDSASTYWTVIATSPSATPITDTNYETECDKFISTKGVHSDDSNYVVFSSCIINHDLVLLYSRGDDDVVKRYYSSNGSIDNNDVVVSL